MTRRARSILLAALLVLAATSVAPARAIVGGQETGAKQYRFMAALEWRESLRCGATVIAPRWVVTAAHCLGEDPFSGEKPKLYDLTLVIGRWDRSDERSGRRIGVDKALIHPFYNEDFNSRDVALLHLRRDAGVTPIRLAALTDNKSEANGSLVRTAGWGSQMPIAGEVLTSNRLRSVQLHVVRDADCVDISDPATQLCAGDYLKDSCHGDSGGPLFAERPTGPVQIGIVSYGIGCGVPELPGVYTEVNERTIRNWITRITGV